MSLMSLVVAMECCWIFSSCVDILGSEVNGDAELFKCFNCKYMVGISMCRLNEHLSMLCQASLNSRACLVAACPMSLVCDQSNLCPLSSVCFAGSELWSCLFIAF